MSSYCINCQYLGGKSIANLENSTEHWCKNPKLGNGNTIMLPKIGCYQLKLLRCINENWFKNKMEEKMNETKTFNGKTYQPLETYEEAEVLLGKKLIGGRENNNLKSSMLITHIKLYDNNLVKVNKLQLDYVFRFYTHEDGSPVGKEILKVVREFELLDLSFPEIHATIQFGISTTEAIIRKYIAKQGWTDTKPWDGDKYHYFIVLNNPYIQPGCLCVYKWEVIREVNYNHLGISIDTMENAEWLCEQLNKDGIIL